MRCWRRYIAVTEGAAGPKLRTRGMAHPVPDVIGNLAAMALAYAPLTQQRPTIDARGYHGTTIRPNPQPRV